MSARFYDPFHDFDRLFDEAFNSRVGGGNNQLQHRPSGSPDGLARSFKPRMDLHENSETNTVTATFELPGVKKEDVELDLREGKLTISAESKISEEHKQDGYAVRERRFGKFSRTLLLPQGVTAEQIKASMENGLLAITFPKTTPELAPKKITIS